jgi:antitoxin component of RelBE/YafQ-DinJ toxin-antitoxin module
MNSVLLSIKTDEKTKLDLRAFAAELGISSTALVNLVVKQALRDRRIVLSGDFIPTPYLEKIMREADADYVAGRNITYTRGKTGALAHLDSLMKK